jgi:hypothetical protein
MKMNVDLKSDSSRGVGVDMFNHSSDEGEDDDDNDEDDDDDEDYDEDEDNDEEEEEDENNGEEDQEDDDDDDDGDDDNGEEGEVANGVHNSIGCSMLNVTPRNLQMNHNPSTLHMSRIHWPPGSWQDGTRRSAFQPYRVRTVSVGHEYKIKRPICFKFINSEMTQAINVVNISNNRTD